MPAEIAHRILDWFAANARTLPWRNPPGRPLPLDDPHWPYRVWLSEIMLQQTTVAAVIPRYTAFLARWPGVAALAGATDADVMAAWAGLGYYARARNLLACARAVTTRHGGRFPDTEQGLRGLPGIGTYSAAAIAAIAFGRRAVVIDANVERVTARLFAEPDKRAIPALVDAITPERAGDFAQAMMDLGAAVCTARAPACARCPLASDCAGRDTPETFPAKPARPARPNRFGTAWWIGRGDEVLLVRRPETGLLGGMRALPSSPWTADGAHHPPPLPGDWRDAGMVSHIFTHFRLALRVQAIRLEKGCKPPLAGEWWPTARLADAGLPTLFKKAATLAGMEDGA